MTISNCTGDSDVIVSLWHITRGIVDMFPRRFLLKFLQSEIIFGSFQTFLVHFS